MVVGAGRMGGALISGWLSNNVITAERLVILDPNPGAAAKAAIAAGALHLSEVTDRLEGVKVVVLAIKPQMFAALGPKIVKGLPEATLIISILAGTSLAHLQACFKSRPIIRAMPNTPAAIGAGITAYTGGQGVTAEHKQSAEILLRAGGGVHEVENEHMIDIVTAVSGSGPAYVFHMVEALETAAIKLGLPEKVAPDFARQTIIGAGALLSESGDSAAALRRAVTSPNGTTQAALEVLMSKEGLGVLMEETVTAAFSRAKALAQG